jgi:hypothetical protein
MSLHPPGFIEPCLPTGSRTAPTGPQWAYEIKHDGFRFICHRSRTGSGRHLLNCATGSDHHLGLTVTAGQPDRGEGER